MRMLEENNRCYDPASGDATPPHSNGKYSPLKLPHSSASGRVVSSSSHEEGDGGGRGGGGEREYSEPRNESGMGEGWIVTHVLFVCTGTKHR